MARSALWHGGVTVGAGEAGASIRGWLAPTCPVRRSSRVYTVMSGVFGADRLKAYRPSSVLVLPGDTFHFHWAKSGEYVTQVTRIGALGL